MMYTDVESRHEDINHRVCGELTYTLTDSASLSSSNKVTYDLPTTTVSLQNTVDADILYNAIGDSGHTVTITGCLDNYNTQCGSVNFYVEILPCQLSSLSADNDADCINTETYTIGTSAIYVDISCVTFTQTPACGYSNNTFTGSNDGADITTLWTPPFTVESANDRVEVFGWDTSLYDNHNPKTVYVHNTFEYITNHDDDTSSVDTVFSFQVNW